MRFQEQNHKYFNDAGAEYISVTRLIETFVPPFRSEYWSMYKAIKKAFLEKFGIRTWNDFKWSVGGWEKVVDNFDRTHPLWDLVKDYQDKYLLEWKIKNKKSTDRGSKIHKKFEEDKGIFHHRNKFFQYSQVNPLEYRNFDSYVYHNELLVYHHGYRVAGQVDKVTRRGKSFDILDYKTNEKLEYEGFRGETMLEPLQHYPNSNFWHYTLQLSLYAWIIESYGYQPGDLIIGYIYGNNDEKMRHIPVEYVKKDVELMLSHYAEV